MDHREKNDLNFWVGFSAPNCSATCALRSHATDRCDAGGALELLNRRDAGDLCLPVAKTELFDHVQAFDGFIALEHELNERERRGSGFPRSIPG